MKDVRTEELIKKKAKIVYFTTCLDCPLSRFLYPNRGYKARIVCGDGTFVCYMEDVLKDDFKFPDWCPLEDFNDVFSFWLMNESAYTELLEEMGYNMSKNRIE